MGLCRAFLISGALLLANPALADTMRFEAFGFTVSVPDGHATCARADNGVAFYIDGKPAEPGCAVKPDRRMIIVSAQTNTSGGAGAHSFAGQQCSSIEYAPEHIPPNPANGQARAAMTIVPSLEVGHRASWSCRISANRGDDLFVTTECPLPSRPAWEELNCSAWMHTNSRVFGEDLALLRRVVGSVKFFRAKPADPPLNLVGPAGSCPTTAASVPNDGRSYKLRDPRSGLTLRLEGDRRHITAIDANGRVIWRKNPFVDANMQPYRTAHPIIVWINVLPNCAIGPESERSYLISIAFNSSQFGRLDVRTGDFVFLGQD